MCGPPLTVVYCTGEQMRIFLLTADSANRFYGSGIAAQRRVISRTMTLCGRSDGGSRDFRPVWRSRVSAHPRRSKTGVI
jgi:hypothetical protein